jgi:hypothetical protein
MAMIELDFNELYNGGKKKKKSKSRRGGKLRKQTKQLMLQLLLKLNYNRRCWNNAL